MKTQDWHLESRQRQTQRRDAYVTRTVVNVALAIKRATAGREEGTLVEETLWPAIRDAGVKRELFDRAITVVKTQPGVFQSYDRLYVPGENGDA